MKEFVYGFCVSGLLLYFVSRFTPAQNEERLALYFGRD
jgi:hypothetical protein